jgi:hypothetical protein
MSESTDELKELKITIPLSRLLTEGITVNTGEKLIVTVIDDAPGVSG